MTTSDYTKFQAAIARNLAGLSFISTGACPGCAECGLAPRECKACDGTGAEGGEDRPDVPDCHCCKGEGKVEATEQDREYAEEAGFSWHACEACGNNLGGDRHPAHGRDSNGDILHLSVCTDCLCYLNYGQLDDLTMMEMETA